MAKRCQGLNSKCFLFTYLVIVSFLLILWLNRLPLVHEELRDIPVELQAYIASPARAMNESHISIEGELVLTSNWLEDKWTLVYFSHANCFPACEATLIKMAEFDAAYATHDVQSMILDLDSETNAKGSMAQQLTQKGFRIVVADASSMDITALAKTFIALFLRTDFSDGSYQIEQEHMLFIVDPKARVYASFDQLVPSKTIKQTFAKLRAFYARTE
jgi:cytochrome oxidase Cu insertion factor (SCO1/SenC/PrrC family)